MNEQDRQLHVDIPSTESMPAPRESYTAWDMHLLLEYDPVKLFYLLDYFFGWEIVSRNSFSAADVDLVRRLIEKLKTGITFQECYAIFEWQGEVGPKV